MVQAAFIMTERLANLAGVPGKRPIGATAEHKKEYPPSVAGQNLAIERAHVAKPRKRTIIKAKLQARERSYRRRAM